jgi:P-type Cu2+ transporter
LVRELQSQGLSVVIASGDTPETVRTAATTLSVPEYHACINPRNKLDFVEQTQAKGRNVLMVGDGINDAPVLAAACAMTQSAAIAQAAADLLLLNGSLQSLATGIRVAQHARRIVRQNLGWALVYNLVSVPLAAAELMAPWVAALGMSIMLAGCRHERRTTGMGANMTIFLLLIRLGLVLVAVGCVGAVLGGQLGTI